MFFLLIRVLKKFNSGQCVCFNILDPLLQYLNVKYSSPFWQLKEEETKKLRDSLEQQKHEAKSREEELHAEAKEKVLIICCLIYAITFNTIALDAPMFLFR